MRFLCLLTLLASCASVPPDPRPDAARAVWILLNREYRACGVPYRQERRPGGTWRVWFLTARHFAGELVGYRARSGSRTMGLGVLEGTSKTADMAVVRFDTPSPVRLIDLATDPPRLGAQVWAAGYGGAYEVLWVEQGLASGKGRMTAPIYFGDSGGAVLNTRGQCVGIISAVETKVLHHAFYAPVSDSLPWILTVGVHATPSPRGSTE